METTGVRKRWSPWWAVVVSCVTLLLPLALLGEGLNQLSLSRSGGYMSELSGLVWPFLVGAAVVLATGPVLYLVLRQRALFVVAMAVTVVALCIPFLAELF